MPPPKEHRCIPDLACEERGQRVDMPDAKTTEDAPAMKLTSLPRKVLRGMPYLQKEVRAIISDNTPFFVAVPRTVYFWRRGPCNAKCIMCDYGFLKGEALKKLMTSRFPDELIPRALDEIAELSGRGTMVSYMAGEPIVNRNIIGWVEQCGRLGLDFRFTTNGYLLDEQMAERFVASGLFNIGVSLESTDPKINEILRPYKNGTSKTIQAIESLIAERQRQKKYTSINIKTMLCDLNLESFIEIIQRWGKVDGVMVTPQIFENMVGMPGEVTEKLRIKDVPRFQRTLDRIRELKREGYNVHVSDQALDEFAKSYAEDPRRENTMCKTELEMAPDAPVCNIATDNLWIDDGYVKLCPLHPPIGDFLNDKLTLKQMWNSEMTKQVRAGTRACRRLCTISCLRRSPLRHKVTTFLKIA
jgi:sulfatase maturation enzyme AslB (radical SAM superfamily)